MGRAVLSIVAGVVLAMVTIFVVEWLGHQMFPPPGDLDWSNRQAVSAYMENVPVPSLAIVLFGYALASFLGGGLAAHLMKSAEWWPSVTVGGVVLLGALMNVQLIPHPGWFKAVAIILPLPCAYIGFHLIKKRV